MEDDEIKDSLAGMIKSNSLDDIKLAISIIENDAEASLYKDVWYNIKDYITKETSRYVELYCKDGTADKVYIIVENCLKKQSYGNQYRTIAYYGRRGKSMRTNDLGVSHSKDWQLENMMNKKLEKGYKIINEFPCKE